MSNDLAKRIDRLESIDAIKKLKHLYMNYCDLGYPPTSSDRSLRTTRFGSAEISVTIRDASQSKPSSAEFPRRSSLLRTLP